jgi:hypothetical protein
MGRPPLERRLRPLVQAYLEAAVSKAASDAPITQRAVAAAVGADRRTIGKHFARDIMRAAADQRAGRHPSARESERRAYAGLLRGKQDAIERLNRQVDGLLERLARVEGNAAALGLDPERLYAPLHVPDRSVSRAGKRRAATRYT